MNRSHNTISHQVIYHILYILCLLFTNSSSASTSHHIIKNSTLFNKNTDIIHQLDAPISAVSGSINAWINPSKSSINKSKPIVTIRWSDNNNGYLALSHGWWEQVSKNHIFFVINNQEKFHCSISYNIDIDAWSMVTATWQSGSSGYCHLYVDGKLVARSSFNKKLTYESKNIIYIGNDKGSTDKRQRKFLGEIAELVILDYPLKETDIQALLRNDKYNNETNTKKKNRWLDSTANKQLLEQELVDKENRVIFDPDIMWSTSKTATDNILKRVKEAGFNTYIPYVWHGRGTYFYSDVAHMSKRLSPKLDGSYDPLEYLIKKAHSMNIEVHPCLVIARREDNQLPHLYDEGTPKNAYNIHLPEFREFIHDLLIEVTTQYNVDGINLDYIRTMGICESKFCQDNYKKETGHDFEKDYYLRFISGSSRKRIQSWQDKAITEIVSDFSRKAKKIKPNLIISVDAHPVPTGERRALNGRDSVTWANNDLIDVIYNMDYNSKIDYEKADRVYNSLINKKKLIPLFANYDLINNKAVKRSGETVAKYVYFSREKWPRNGFAVYLFHQMSDSQVNALSKGPFKTQANTNWPN